MRPLLTWQILAQYRMSGKWWAVVQPDSYPWLLQGEKLSSTLIFTVLQVAAGLLLGIHLPADLAQLVIFLPNSRYHSLTRSADPKPPHSHTHDVRTYHQSCQTS